MSATICWGVHMPAALGQRAVESGFIAVGPPEIGDVSPFLNSRDSFKKAYLKTFPGAKPMSVAVNAGQIFRFCHEMQIGDVVVHPLKADRTIAIGEVVDRYAFRPSVDPAYPHQRAVRWVVNVPRETFSQDALYEVGSALTFFRIVNYADQFVAALTGDTSTIVAEHNGDDQVSTVQFAASAEESTEDFILRRLKEAQNSHQFEYFVAHLLECMGYHTRVTKASGDGGVDVIAHKDELGFEPPIVKVQCKQTSITMDRPDVQKLIGAVEHGEMALFVTLGGFSTGARTFEQTKANLRLIDGRTLVELIKAHYPRFSPRYQALIPLKQTYLPNL